MWQPFGMSMPGRKFAAANEYRYEFNGKENDKDISEGGQDYGMRISDNRLGRFLSEDPITKKYPELTPYQFASNRPIDGIDEDGLEYSPAGRSNDPKQTARESTSVSPGYCPISPAEKSKNDLNINLVGKYISDQNATLKARSTVFQQTPATVSEATKQGRREHHMDPETGEKTFFGKIFETKKYENLNENIVQPFVEAAILDGAGRILVGGTIAAAKTSSNLWKVGSYSEIKGLEVGLDAHHVGQKAVMKNFVPGYNLNTAPSILVPEVGHTIRGVNGIVSRSTSGFTNAREVLARDIFELRRVYGGQGIPNSSLQQLIQMNKTMYLGAFIK